MYFLHFCDRLIIVNMSAPEFKLPTPLKMDDFEQGVTLGTGSFGRVKFVNHTVSVF